MVTANGEVHTNEEAHLYVYDLNLFVIVQILEETPAVLSLGKLCEDHGYSYEWVSGQKTRLTKEGKTIMCKTDNFLPLVVPGLSTSLEAVRCQHRHCRHQKPKNKKRDGSRDADDRLRDLPESPKQKQ